MNKFFLFVFAGIYFAFFTVLSGLSSAAATQDLTAAQKETLVHNWQLIQKKMKGPYGLNYCVCSDGTKNRCRQRTAQLPIAVNRRISVARFVHPGGRP